MFDGKFPIDVDLVRRLVGAQFPHWSELEIRPVSKSGWDNFTFHLGPEMLVRLPSAAEYAAQVAKEQKWLPILAGSLPLPIPNPVAMGAPGEDYPWHWSVYRWLEGETASAESIDDLGIFAADLGGFLQALQGADATGGPPPGAHNFYRGGALRTYDAETRQSLAVLDDEIDVGAVTALWDAALSSKWRHAPVWVHGDLAATNLLILEGRLSAVIDFGCCAVGDPACDLAIAWTLLDPASRAAFREALSLDDATWQRGRGWTLWKALISIVQHRKGNVPAADEARRVLRGVLADAR